MNFNFYYYLVLALFSAFTTGLSLYQHQPIIIGGNIASLSLTLILVIITYRKDMKRRLTV